MKCLHLWTTEDLDFQNQILMSYSGMSVENENADRKEHINVCAHEESQENSVLQRTELQGLPATVCQNGAASNNKI